MSASHHILATESSGLDFARSSAAILEPVTPVVDLRRDYQPRSGTRSACAASRVALERIPRRVFVPQHSGRWRQGARLLLGLDLAVIAFCHSSLTQPSGVGTSVLASALLALPVVTALYLAGAYRLETLARGLALKQLGMISALAAFSGWTLLWLLERSAALPGAASLGSLDLLGVVCALTASVVLSRFGLRSLLRRSSGSARILVIGSTATTGLLRAELASHQRSNAVLHFAVDPRDVADDSLALDQLEAQFDGWVKAVVLDLDAQDLPTSSQADLVHARLCGIPIINPASLIEDIWERTPVAGHDRSWIYRDGNLASISPGWLGAKRLLDLSIAIPALLLLSPLLLLVAVAVRLSSPGPALYRQTRVGLGKREFQILKFRSMRSDAEADGARWASQQDARVTPIGSFLRKSRIDELPQFWNVLRGDMSLIGPRPERPEFNRQLEELVPYYDLRHLVKPGISGWAQVCYPYGASVEDTIAKLEYDVYYIRHGSLGFDLRILLRTVGVMLGLRGR